MTYADFAVKLALVRIGTSKAMNCPVVGPLGARRAQVVVGQISAAIADANKLAEKK
jgi:hypothetical protein